MIHRSNNCKIQVSKNLLELEKVVGEFLYQSSLLVGQINDVAELFNCGVKERDNKFAQSALKQST
ncbi:hypothetical protein GO684_04820, partial [Wolbachia endosymbiont of Litomosoides brasiliensis]|uniref:hypothetical protein n=1 Tax=Wolbachia endosymbiont of Litomosoides brasiliensis TaxID=1812117 RepID=UPI00158C1B4F